MRAHYQLSIDPELKAKLQGLSKKSGLSMAKLVDAALRKELPRLAKRYAAFSNSSSRRKPRRASVLRKRDNEQSGQ